MSQLLDLYPNTDPRTQFRWDAIPEGARLEEHCLHARWLDLVWWREEDGVWVYVSTRPNPGYNE